MPHSRTDPTPDCYPLTRRAIPALLKNSFACREGGRHKPNDECGKSNDESMMNDEFGMMNQDPRPERLTLFIIRNA
jgi:hypothetical protein